MAFKTLEELQEYNKKSHESIFGKMRIQQEKVLDINGLSYFERITAISQPHKVFKLDWSSYGSIDFADTFLPNVNGYKATALWMYDGAELFKDLQISNKKTMSLSNDKKLINIVSYTYPKGVLAEKQKNTVSVGAHEICTFIEVNKDNSIDIHFKFGDNFKEFLDDYFNDIDKFVSISSLENKTYKTTIQKFQKFFNRKLVHYNMMQYILETLGVEISEVNLKKRLIQEVVWLNIKNKNINKDKKSKLSNIFFGEKVKLKIIGKRLKARHKLTITIGFKIKDKIVYPQDLKKYQFEITPKDNKAETPYFKIPFEWYDEAKEYYDYSDYKTKIKEEDILQITVKIEVKKKEIFLEDNEILVPNSYHRNYEELIGLFKKNTWKAEKDRKENYENYFISLNKKIEKLVVDFENFIYQSDDLKLNQIENRIKKDAKQLWLLAVNQSQSGNLDDRPLYWARNKMQATLKRHPLFKNDIDLERSIVTKDSELDKIIILFEKLSRNYTGIDFSKGKPNPDKVAQAEKQLQDAKNLPSTTQEEITVRENAINEAETNLEKAKKVYKILITGFDPFFLNQFDNKEIEPYGPNILQSNPSGCVALNLHNQTLANGFIQTMIVPVRYTDFDSDTNHFSKKGGKGIIERYIGEKYIDKVDMIITISQAGPGDYHIDVFATATRGGFNDNMDYVRENGSKSISDSAPETIVTTLNEMFVKSPSKAKYEGYYNKKSYSYSRNSTINDYPKKKIYNGPGGNYLSNEIFYRVANLRQNKRPKLQTGHFHISKLQKDQGQDFVNYKMNQSLEIIKTVIKNGIKGL